MTSQVQRSRIISLLDVSRDIRQNDSVDELKQLFLTLDPNLGQIAGDEKRELITQLLDVFSIEKYKKGQTIYEQSTPPLKYYLILEGEVTMYLPKNNTANASPIASSSSFSLIAVRQLQVKDSFGQKSLTYNKPHLCTCIASRETTCAVLSQSDFIRYLKKPFSLQESKDINFLWELDYLKSLNFRKIKTLHNAAEILLFKTGQHVYKEDLDLANYAYIIKSGTFIIHKKVRPPSSESNSNYSSNPMHHLQLGNKKLVKKRICIMSIGELFGIEDLIEKEPKRTYTVQCHSDEGELFAISKELFQVLIMTEPQCAQSIKRLYKAYSKRMANLIMNKEMYFMFRNNHNSIQEKQDNTQMMNRSNKHQQQDHHHKHKHHHHKHHHHHQDNNNKEQGYSSSSSSSSSTSLSPSNHFAPPTRNNNKKLTLQYSPSPINRNSQQPAQQSKGSIMFVSSINPNSKHNTHDTMPQSKLESFTQALHNEHQQLLQKKTIDLNRRKTKVLDEYNSPSNTSIGGQSKPTANHINSRAHSSISQGNIGEKQFQFLSNLPHSPTVSLTLLESESQQQSKANDSSVSSSCSNSESRESSKNRIDKRQKKQSKHSKTLKLIGEQSLQQQQQQKQHQYSLPSSQDLIGDQSHDLSSYQNNDNKPQEKAYSRQITHGSFRYKGNNNSEEMASSDDGERNPKKRQSKRSVASTTVIQESQQQQQSSPQYSYSSKCLPILEEESIAGSKDDFVADQRIIPHYSQFHNESTSNQQQKSHSKDSNPLGEEYPDNPRAVEIIGFVNKKEKIINNSTKKDIQQPPKGVVAEIVETNSQLEQPQQNPLERQVDYVSCYSYLPSISTYFLKKQASPIDQVMDRQYNHIHSNPSKYSRDPVIIMEEKQQGQEEQEESKYQSLQQQDIIHTQQHSQSSEQLPASRLNPSNPQRKLAATLSTFQSQQPYHTKKTKKQVQNLHYSASQTAYDTQFIHQKTETSMNNNNKTSHDALSANKTKQKMVTITPTTTITGNLSMNPSASSLTQPLQSIRRSGSHTPTGYQPQHGYNGSTTCNSSKAKFMLGDPPKKEVIGIFNPQFFTKLKSKFLKEFTNNPQISKDIYQYKLEDFLKKHLHSGPLHDFLEKNEQVDSFQKKIEHEKQLRAKNDEADFKRQSRLISCIASKKGDISGLMNKNKREDEEQRKETKTEQLKELSYQQQQQNSLFNSSHNQSIDSSINGINTNNNSNNIIVINDSNEKSIDNNFVETALSSNNNKNNSTDNILMMNRSCRSRIVNNKNTDPATIGIGNSMNKTESFFSQQRKGQHQTIISPNSCSPFQAYSLESQQTFSARKRNNNRSDDNILESLLRQDIKNSNTSSNGIVASRSYRGLHSLMRFSLPLNSNNNTHKGNVQVTTTIAAPQVQRMGLNGNNSNDKKAKNKHKSQINSIMLDKINKPGKKQEALPLLPKQIRNYNDSFYRFNPKEVQQQ